MCGVLERWAVSVYMELNKNNIFVVVFMDIVLCSAFVHVTGDIWWNV